MQNAMQKAMNDSGLKRIILPLHKVWDGSKCIHTGTVRHKGKAYPSKLGEQDKGVAFVKTCNAFQNLGKDGRGRRVIFGLNDMVEVVKG